MRYIKTYEASKERDISKPRVGDYVLINIKYNGDDEDMISYSTFINNNIGRIFRINKAQFVNEMSEVCVEYNNITPEVREWFNYINDNKYDDTKGWRQFSLGRIKELASTKKELKLKIQTDKYNL